MKLIKNFILILGLAITFSCAFIPATAQAADIFKSCEGDTSSFVCGNKDDDIKTYLKNGVNILLYILGAVAVIMIILSGIYYTISGGDSTATAKAKNTLMYSVIGLIVALSALAIVNLVLTNFKV